MAIPNISSPRQVLETKYKNSRNNLLLVVAFTLINIILLIAKSDSYFLFSASIPYALVDFGMALCGMYPAEYYGGDMADMAFLPPAVFVILLVMVLIVVALYFVSWLCSKNNRGGWLVFALVIFAVDTLGMLALMGISPEGIIDIVFHVWVIISLALGIHAWRKLKQLPADEPEVAEADPADVVQVGTEHGGILRAADPDVKVRVLLEAQALGHTVTYRRVKRVNELVIDGYVYDEIEALVETAHSLKAQIDGHLIEVGFDGAAHSYLKVDGQPTARKIRLY